MTDLYTVEIEWDEADLRRGMRQLQHDWDAQTKEAKRGLQQAREDMHRRREQAGRQLDRLMIALLLLLLVQVLIPLILLIASKLP